MANYYSILGLKQGASKDEIRKAYRKLAFQYHPDKNPSPSAKQKFIEITEAYDALMSGRSFSFTRGFSTTAPKPKPKTEKEIRREKAAHYHDSLQKKFSELRKNYNSPQRRPKEYKEKYREINRLFTASAVIFVGAIVVPFLILQPGMLIMTFPLGLGFGIRLFWSAGRKKLKADMIFGPQEHYSTDELREFFNTGTELGTRTSQWQHDYWSMNN